MDANHPEKKKIEMEAGRCRMLFKTKWTGQRDQTDNDEHLKDI